MKTYTSRGNLEVQKIRKKIKIRLTFYAVNWTCSKSAEKCCAIPHFYPRK